MKYVSIPLLACILTGCGGNASPLISATPNISGSEVTASQFIGARLVGGYSSWTLTVQPSGSATMTYETTPPQSFTRAVPPSLVSQLYTDLARALPLSALPPTSPHVSLEVGFTISVAGQSSPNIVGDQTGIAHTLVNDVGNIEAGFPVPSPTP